MKKYLFFLAFILPFMAMGQFKMSAADKKTFDSLVQAPLKLAPSHTNCFSKDSNYLKAEWVGDQMPTTDGDKDGVIKVTMHPTNITFDSKGRVDSVYYEKDSTVKGWIVYYKKGLVTKQWTTMCYSTLNGHYPIKVSSTKQGVQQVIKEATAHYRVIRIFDDMPYRPKYWEIYKIEVDGKPFDLNKYYQFIPENQVVE